MRGNIAFSIKYIGIVLCRQYNYDPAFRTTVCLVNHQLYESFCCIKKKNTNQSHKFRRMVLKSIQISIMLAFVWIDTSVMRSIPEFQSLSSSFIGETSRLPQYVWAPLITPLLLCLDIVPPRDPAPHRQSMGLDSVQAARERQSQRGAPEAEVFGRILTVCREISRYNRGKSLSVTVGVDWYEFSKRNWSLIT